VFIQSQELADRIFNTIDDNYSGFMDWPEFINGMKIIKAKTLKDKIDLFIKVNFLFFS
jgi:Ca2+-binding EF-hand superfamily protein